VNTLWEEEGQGDEKKEKRHGRVHGKPTMARMGMEGKGKGKGRRKMKGKGSREGGEKSGSGRERRGRGRKTIRVECVKAGQVGTTELVNTG
jgi:hypothetical protein